MGMGKVGFPSIFAIRLCPEMSGARCAFCQPPYHVKALNETKSFDDPQYQQKNASIAENFGDALEQGEF